MDIPLDTSIMEGADEGRPIVISSTSSNPLVQLKEINLKKLCHSLAFLFFSKKTSIILTTMYFSCFFLNQILLSLRRSRRTCR